MFMEYISEYHTGEVETNYVFIKINGEHKYKLFKKIVTIFSFKSLMYESEVKL